MSLRVTVWNEYRHELKSEKIAAIYPDGMHAPIVAHLNAAGLTARAATQDQPEHGLTDDVLNSTDVLTWWGHTAHSEVSDEIVERVYNRVIQGMGLIVLHSAHFSKIFKKLMGTSCSLAWREAGEKERHWVVNPGHPITQGLDRYFEIPHHEMYSEYFDVPEPTSTIFISWVPGGNVFRSGLTYQRGRGKIFYFSPGHETFPVYYQPEILKVIENGVRWAAPSGSNQPVEEWKKAPALETIEPYE